MGLFDKIDKLIRKDAPNNELKELSLREGTAEFEYFIAGASLASNENLEHGMSHLAELLAYDPARREWLELLDRYVEAAGGDGLSLLPEKEERYFATEAVRALFWARQGRLEEAVGLWLAVVNAKPEVPYLETWVLSSLEPEGALESLSPQQALYVFSAALSSYPEHRLAIAKRRKTAARFARLARRMPVETPNSDAVHMVVAGLHRKAGLFEDGLRYLAENSDRGGSWHLAVAEGLLYREKGATEAAEAAFKKALVFDTEDITARLEAGDMYVRTEEWSRAIAWYDSVLKVEPEHAWARPSHLWCQWRAVSDAPFPDDRFPDELRALAREGNDRAESLLTPFYPYNGYLPEPQDATANTLRQMLEHYEKQPPDASADDGPSDLKLTLSDVEAPSNLIALRMAMAALGVDIRLRLTFKNIATPDPREPLDAVRYRLWKREVGVDTLVPALEPPPSEVASSIAAIAARPYERRENWVRASVVAGELGPERVEDILACIVHPPPMPEGGSALVWIPRVQLAACDVLAHLDEGWEGSVRRDALYSVLLGPLDWSTESAILALHGLASEYPVIEGDLHEAFTKLWNGRPDSGYIGYEHALVSVWLALTILFDDERKDLEAELKRIEDEWDSE